MFDANRERGVTIIQMQCIILSYNVFFQKIFTLLQWKDFSFQVPHPSGNSSLAEVILSVKKFGFKDTPPPSLWNFY